MKKNQTAALAACIMTLAVMAPSAMADAEPYHQHNTVTGVAGMHMKEGVGFGVVTCVPDPTFPVAPCEPNPGGISSLGGAIFFVDGSDPSESPFDPEHNWNCVNDNPPGPNPLATCGMTGREVRIWIELAPGSVSAGGFGAMVCADTNDDMACTTPSEYAVAAWAGNGDTVCDDDSKDTKDCDSPDELELYVCIPRNNYVRTDPATGISITDTSFDDFYVYTRWWADTTFINSENSADNTGTGLSFGNFDVYAEYGEFLDADSCEYENTGDDPGTAIDEGERPDWNQSYATGGGFSTGGSSGTEAGAKC